MPICRFLTHLSLVDQALWNAFSEALVEVQDPSHGNTNGPYGPSNFFIFA